MSFNPDRYIKAKTASEVLSLLDEQGERAAIIAGSTEFHELVTKEMVPEIKTLIDIEQLDLNYINSSENGIRMGATTRLCEIRDEAILQKQPEYAAIREAATILPVQVVERGTIGGNICAGLPILNFPTVIVALDAALVVISSQGERIIPAGEFFLEYFLTNLQPNELLTEIRIPRFPQGTASVFLASKILSLDYPTVSIAVRLQVNGDGTCKDVSMVLGSVSRTPVKTTRTEDKLRGKKLEDSVIDEVAKNIIKEIEPISDLRASAEYRKEMSKVLAEDALKKARDRITSLEATFDYQTGSE